MLTSTILRENAILLHFPVESPERTLERFVALYFYFSQPVSPPSEILHPMRIISIVKLTCQPEIAQCSNHTQENSDQVPEK